MSWQKKKEHIDLRTGMHVVHLHNPDTKGEHILQLNIGHNSCPHCGHVKVQDKLEAFDIHQIVAAEIELLNQNHQAMLDHAERSKVKPS